MRSIACIIVAALIIIGQYAPPRSPLSAVTNGLILAAFLLMATRPQGPRT